MTYKRIATFKKDKKIIWMIFYGFNYLHASIRNDELFWSKQKGKFSYLVVHKGF